jgi:hypothetical protein
MPTWVKVAIDAWTSAAALSEGHVLRPVNRGDQVQGERMTEKVVWQLLQPYATAAGIPGIAPHDMRRTCAKLCRAPGGELEQIQLLLGHASVQTTEPYLGTKQDLVHAPNDGIGLRLVAAVTHFEFRRETKSRNCWRGRAGSLIPQQAGLKWPDPLIRAGSSARTPGTAWCQGSGQRPQTRTTVYCHRFTRYSQLSSIA